MNNGPSYVLTHILIATVFALTGAAAYGFLQAADGLVELMAFYGVYHSNPVNQLIHFFFVPGIVWTALIIMSHCPIFFGLLTIPSLPSLWPTHTCTWATAAFFFYLGFYLWMDSLGGALFFPFLLGMYASAVKWYRADQKAAAKKSWTGTGKLIRRAWLWHSVGWYMQIHPGHKIFEGAQPAIMESLGGALTSAPLFAFHEGIWWVGLRQDMHQKVVLRVDELRHQLCEHGANMRQCSSIIERDSTDTNDKNTIEL